MVGHRGFSVRTLYALRSPAPRDMDSLFDIRGTGTLVRVAVERGIDRHPEGLTYAVPAELGALRAGERVVVPLGRGDTPTAGYVIETIGATDASASREKVKEVLRRDDAGIALPQTLVELATWVAAYYACPIGVALAGILPAAVKKQVGAVTRAFVDLGSDAADENAAGYRFDDSADAKPRKPRRLTPKQVAVIEHLRALEPSQRPVELRTLAKACGLATNGPVTSLVQRGALVVTRRTSVEAEWSAQSIEPATVPSLTADQARAVDAIAATLGLGFSAHLLFGVTGSGKTEVYLRLIDQALAAGRTSLMLVPEIALTPQTGGRIVARFPQRRVAILHSGLTAAQRHQQWALVADGSADVILGARSAVFAPIPAGRLGLIVVDEEHDASYKQDQSPRYHGRDVAMRRAQLERVPVVLGSATPSLESWHNATVRKAIALHRLPVRAPGLTTPVVRIVDFRVEQAMRSAGPIAPEVAHGERSSSPTARDTRIRLVGPTLEHAVSGALRDGRQAILLLNRRGFGNYIACPDRACGWKLECDDCDATMVCHLGLDRIARLRAGDAHAGMYVRCHHCDAERLLPVRCPRCQNRITVFGLGTQRVEEELERTFGLRSGVDLLRVDGDTMQSARDLHDALRRFGRGEVKVMLGTQMIAKGLDFPNVRVVGVISADTALALPDFRSSERTFQLVSQVAGRCGRGADPGLAIVQTFEPELAPIVLAAAAGFERFAAEELEDRARWSLPPITRMARIVVRDKDLQRCEGVASDLAESLRGIVSRPGGTGDPVEIRGPSPCPIGRIAGRHRQEVTLIARRAADLQRILAAARDVGAIRPGEQMAVDVDPMSMS